MSADTGGRVRPPVPGFSAPFLAGISHCLVLSSLVLLPRPVGQKHSYPTHKITKIELKYNNEWKGLNIILEVKFP